jgi:hypothetical protein
LKASDGDGLSAWHFAAVAGRIDLISWLAQVMGDFEVRRHIHLDLNSLSSKNEKLLFITYWATKDYRFAPPLRFN